MSPSRQPPAPVINYGTALPPQPLPVSEMQPPQPPPPSPRQPPAPVINYGTNLPPQPLPVINYETNLPPQPLPVSETQPPPQNFIYRSEMPPPPPPPIRQTSAPIINCGTDLTPQLLPVIESQQPPPQNFIYYTSEMSPSRQPPAPIINHGTDLTQHVKHEYIPPPSSRQPPVPIINYEVSQSDIDGNVASPKPKPGLTRQSIPLDSTPLSSLPVSFPKTMPSLSRRKKIIPSIATSYPVLPTPTQFPPPKKIPFSSPSPSSNVKLEGSTHSLNSSPEEVIEYYTETIPQLQFKPVLQILPLLSINIPSSKQSLYIGIEPDSSTFKLDNIFRMDILNYLKTDDRWSIVKKNINFHQSFQHLIKQQEQKKGHKYNPLCINIVVYQTFKTEPRLYVGPGATPNYSTNNATTSSSSPKRQRLS